MGPGRPAHPEGHLGPVGTGKGPDFRLVLIRRLYPLSQLSYYGTQATVPHAPGPGSSCGDLTKGEKEEGWRDDRSTD
ncbi:hypothetical protein GCM10009815_38960 [Nocardioides marmoribigeumensis]